MGQISTWKRAALDNISSAFERRGRVPDTLSPADIVKLHSKIKQLVLERDFWPMPQFNCSGREAKNGEQGS